MNKCTEIANEVHQTVIDQLENIEKNHILAKDFPQKYNNAVKSQKGISQKEFSSQNTENRKGAL